MNDTLQLLPDMVGRFRRGQRQRDLQWLDYKRECRDLDQQFRAQHPSNHTLIRQVNDLLDANGRQAEYEGEQWFLLGLQMGLGALEMLREP